MTATSDALYGEIQSIVNCKHMNTVTYGTTSAAYLAVRSLVQLALDEAESSPIASNVILKNFYVDNLVAGADTINEFIQIKNEMKILLAKVD